MPHTFSIRDYTSKMRSRDVFMCWPFPAGGATADQVHSWLPPMTVPSFRWWSDELNKLRSNGAAAVEQQNPPPEEEGAVSREPAESEKLEEEGQKSENPPVEVMVSLREGGEEEPGKSEEEKSELVCPVCRDFNAATLTAVNAHIDGCLREERRRMRRSKSKSKSKWPRKKERSVSEICELEEQEDDNPPEQLQSETETAEKFSPFGEDVSVTVAKFRKLSRRLEALRSNNGSIGRKSARSDGGRPNSEDPSSREEEEAGKLEMVCPVCRVFKGETATAAVANAHIDSCLAQAIREERLKQMRKRLSSNLKPKAPKKRSIAEILTVAPQIDAGTSDVAAENAREEEEDEDNGERVAIKSKKKTKKKKKTMKKVMKKKFKLGKRAGVVPPNDESKKKRKKKKKNLLNNDLASKKACKSKVYNSVNRSIKLKGIGNKTYKLDSIDASCSHEKKLGFKILSEEEKKEQVKNCDSVEKMQQQKEAVSPIVKNPKHISESTSSGCNVQEGNNHEESQCDVQVPKDGDSFDETTSLDDENNLESIRDDDDDNTAMVESKQFPNSIDMDQVGAQNILKPCITNQEESEELVEKGESLSLFDKGNTTPHYHCSPFAEVSRSLSSALQAGQISGKNTQLCESESGAFVSTTREFIDCLDDASVQSANTRTFLGHSSSYSASYSKGNYERPEFGLHAYGGNDNDNNGKALRDRPSSPYMFSADMIDSSPLFRGGRGKESVRDKNFFGFPLNSHGELIDFNSSGKVGMSQPDTSCTLRGSSSQENLTPNEKHVAQKTTLQDGANPFPVPYYPARLGVTTELHGGSGRADINHHNSDRSSSRYDWLLDSELNLARSSPFSEQNQANKKTPNRNGNGIMVSLPNSSPPTMRLMGKDVLISESSKEKQQSEVAAAAIDNSLLGRCSKQDWRSGSPTGQNVLQSVKSQSNPSSLQGTTFIKGNLRVNSNIASPKFHQAPGKLQWNFVSRDKPQALTFQSQVLPSPHPTISPSQGEHNERKSQHHVKTSPFGFPFLHPNVEEHAKTSPSSRGLLPPWMLGSSHERLPSFPHDIRATPSVNHSAQFQHLPNLRKAPLCPPYVPVNLTPLAKQPSASITSGCRNITEVIDLEKLNNDNHHHHHVHLHHHPCTTTNTSRKRPAPPDFIDLTEPSKLPNLGFDSSNQDGAAAAAASCILRPSQNVDQDDSTRRNHSATDFGRDLELQRRLTKKYRF